MKKKVLGVIVRTEKEELQILVCGKNVLQRLVLDFFQRGINDLAVVGGVEVVR